MPPLKSPSAELLRLGAGELLGDRHDANNALTGFMHLGNIETLELTTTDDKLVKKSSMSRGRPVYKSVTRSRDVVMRAVGDEWSADNRALMLMGSVVYATQAATPVVDQVLFANVPAATLGAALGDRYFHVGKLNIGTVTMKLGATVLDADDFTVYNAKMGVIKILSTSTTVTNGADDLLVSYTPVAITGLDSPVVRGGTESEINMSFLFIEDNSAGENHILRIWNASVSPDGALGLISDEFATFALNAALQDDSQGLFGGTVDDPLYHIQYVPSV
jgi:hypothetical protein